MSKLFELDETTYNGRPYLIRRASDVIDYGEVQGVRYVAVPKDAPANGHRPKSTRKNARPRADRVSDADLAKRAALALVENAPCHISVVRSACRSDHPRVVAQVQMWARSRLVDWEGPGRQIVVREKDQLRRIAEVIEQRTRPDRGKTLFSNTPDPPKR